MPSIAIIAKVGGYTLLCVPFLGKYKPAMLLLGMAFWHLQINIFDSQFFQLAVDNSDTTMKGIMLILNMIGWNQFDFT